MLSLFQRKKFFEYSVKAKQIPIGKKRQRGKPRLIAPALDLQEDETTSKEPKKKGTKKIKAPIVNKDSDYDIFDDNEPNDSRGSKRLKQTKSIATAATSSKSTTDKAKTSKKPRAKNTRK